MEEAAQTLARQPLADLRHRPAAADAPGPRQRLPARLHREHGRFRQSAGARRQLRRALDRDLLRHRRRAERSRRRRRSSRSSCSSSRSAPSTPSASGSARRSYTTVSGKGDAGVHPQLPRPLRSSSSTPSSASGRCSPLVIYAHHPLRQLRHALGRRLHADASPTTSRPSPSAGASSACTGAARPGARSGRRCRSR